MSDTRHARKIAILDVLKHSDTPFSSARIAEILKSQGNTISERTVRLYLNELDNEGLTKNLGKRGRLITDEGIAEFENSRTYERVGSLAAKIDQMSYSMSFDLATRMGTVVINSSIVRSDHLVRLADHICRVFESGYAMGRLLSLHGPGSVIGTIRIPEGHIGLSTVCSITLNGVLVRHGIPVHSRFGGLLEIRNGAPTRFVEMIEYSGTTIDPLEAFIRSAMTDYVGAITSGNGRIGASFREIPSASREHVVSLAESLKKIGLGGFMEIGYGGRPVLDTPVSEGRAGAVVIGGLNPMAIFEEHGIRINLRALSGVIEYTDLFHYDELKERIAALV